MPIVHPEPGPAAGGSSRSAHRYLRTATAASHRAAEAAMGLGDRLTEASYIRCLGLFHGLWAPTEAAIGRWADGRPVAWPLEGRARLARHDLLVLGVAAAAITALPRCEVERPDPGPDGVPTAFGYAYVLEGSARGAALLARRLRDELPNAPDSFFSTHELGRWPRFIRSLDEQEWTAASQEQAAAAADRLFAALTALATADPCG